VPDYVGLKDRFVRLRNKNSNKNVLSLSEVVVPETNTTYGTKFLIHDNKKPNRLVVLLLL